MKFSVSSTELQNKLAIASGALSSNPVWPILEDFLFVLSDGNLNIIATDNEAAISTNIPVNTDGTGSVAVPSKILLDTLKALPSQPVTFDINDDDYSISITSAYGNYKLSGQDPAEYPNLPKAENIDSIQISSEALLKGINKTIFATSNDDLRAAMTGVFVEVNFNSITFVATDAHKLVKYQNENLESEVTTSFILPRKGLNLLKSALPSKQNILLKFNNEHAFFEFENTLLVVRLIDDKYPDYSSVIPVDNNYLLSINRLDLLNSLKRIAIYANKTTNQIVFDIKSEEVTINSQDLDFANEAQETLPCVYNGEDLKIGFNARFLIEMLNVLDSEEVTLKLLYTNRAGIIVPNEIVDNENVLMLVMPVNLNY